MNDRRAGGRARVFAPLLVLGWQTPAFAAFSDEKVGTFEMGRLADLAVLSQDIFAIPAETIGRTRVVTTMVGGKIVYQR
jgi:predicted amidohydrolase YtcJ